MNIQEDVLNNFLHGSILTRITNSGFKSPAQMEDCLYTLADDIKGSIEEFLYILYLLVLIHILSLDTPLIDNSR